MQTGVEHLYVQKENKYLRCGFTTGSCAAAASYAATIRLLTGEEPGVVDLMTPKGILLHLPVSWEEEKAGVVKDAGDDPDVTDGALIMAEAVALPPAAEKKGLHGVWDIDRHPFSWSDEEHALTLYLDGGEGVGRVTQPGLSQEVGQAAINAGPRKMIFEAVAAACRRWSFTGSLLITVSVSEGRRLAEKTFNPRLGIRGGISILGTSGIVEPMSQEALIASIRLEMSMQIQSGRSLLLAAPGRYGETFIQKDLGLDCQKAILFSNFVGQTVDLAAELGAEGILFVAHLGKFIKVAGGIMNTHSREADARAELLAAYALRGGASRDAALQILGCRTTDQAVDLMREAGCLEKTVDLVCQAVRDHLQRRCQGRVRTEAILYNGQVGLLGQTEGAAKLLEQIHRQGEELSCRSLS